MGARGEIDIFPLRLFNPIDGEVVRRRNYAQSEHRVTAPARYAHSESKEKQKEREREPQRGSRRGSEPGSGSSREGREDKTRTSENELANVPDASRPNRVKLEHSVQLVRRFTSQCVVSRLNPAAPRRISVVRRAGDTRSRARQWWHASRRGTRARAIVRASRPPRRNHIPSSNLCIRLSIFKSTSAIFSCH